MIRCFARLTRPLNHRRLRRGRIFLNTQVIPTSVCREEVQISCTISFWPSHLMVRPTLPWRGGAVLTKGVEDATRDDHWSGQLFIGLALSQSHRLPWGETRARRCWGRGQETFEHQRQQWSRDGCCQGHVWLGYVNLLYIFVKTDSQWTVICRQCGKPNDKPTFDGTLSPIFGETGGSLSLGLPHFFVLFGGWYPGIPNLRVCWVGHRQGSDGYAETACWKCAFGCRASNGLGNVGWVIMPW